MKKVIVGVMLISALALAGCKIDNREMPGGGGGNSPTQQTN